MGELNRTEVAQGPPQSHQPVGFPTTTTTNHTIYRAKQKQYRAWHFSSVPAVEDGPGGRFHLPAPRGTCYWADTPETALREVVGPYVLRFGAVTDARLGLLAVASGSTAAGEQFADVTAATAVDRGVIRELCTMGDYTVPQAWATAFDEQGLAGVRYSSRFTSEPGPNAWSFFGDADDDGETRFEGSSLDPFDVARMANIRVVTTPSARTKSTDLTAAEIPPA